jgi:hypothetical protein
MFEPINKYAAASAALADIREVARAVEQRAGLVTEADQLS